MCLAAHDKLVVFGWFFQDFLSVRNHDIVEISNHVTTLLLNLAIVPFISTIARIKL